MRGWPCCTPSGKPLACTGVTLFRIKFLKSFLDKSVRSSHTSVSLEQLEVHQRLLRHIPVLSHRFAFLSGFSCASCLALSCILTCASPQTTNFESVHSSASERHHLDSHSKISFTSLQGFIPLCIPGAYQRGGHQHCPGLGSRAARAGRHPGGWSHPAGAAVAHRLLVVSDGESSQVGRQCRGHLPCGAVGGHLHRQGAGREIWGQGGRCHRAER